MTLGHVETELAAVFQCWRNFTLVRRQYRQAAKLVARKMRLSAAAAVLRRWTRLKKRRVKQRAALHVLMDYTYEGKTKSALLSLGWCAKKIRSAGEKSERMLKNTWAKRLSVIFRAWSKRTLFVADIGVRAAKTAKLAYERRRLDRWILYTQSMVYERSLLEYATNHHTGYVLDKAMHMLRRLRENRTRERRLLKMGEKADVLSLKTLGTGLWIEFWRMRKAYADIKRRGDDFARSVAKKNKVAVFSTLVSFAAASQLEKSQTKTAISFAFKNAKQKFFEEWASVVASRLSVRRAAVRVEKIVRRNRADRTMNLWMRRAQSRRAIHEKESRAAAFSRTLLLSKVLSPWRIVVFQAQHERTQDEKVKRFLLCKNFSRWSLSFAARKKKRRLTCVLVMSKWREVVESKLRARKEVATRVLAKNSMVLAVFWSEWRRRVADLKLKQSLLQLGLMHWSDYKKTRALAALKVHWREMKALSERKRSAIASEKRAEQHWKTRRFVAVFDTLSKRCLKAYQLRLCATLASRIRLRESRELLAQGMREWSSAAAASAEQKAVAVFAKNIAKTLGLKQSAFSAEKDKRVVGAGRIAFAAQKLIMRHHLQKWRCRCRDSIIQEVTFEWLKAYTEASLEEKSRKMKQADVHRASKRDSLHKLILRRWWMFAIRRRSSSRKGVLLNGLLAKRAAKSVLVVWRSLYHERIRLKLADSFAATNLKAKGIDALANCVQSRKERDFYAAKRSILDSSLRRIVRVGALRVTFSEWRVAVRVVVETRKRETRTREKKRLLTRIATKKHRQHIHWSFTKWGELSRNEVIIENEKVSEFQRWSALFRWSSRVSRMKDRRETMASNGITADEQWRQKRIVLALNRWSENTRKRRAIVAFWNKTGSTSRVEVLSRVFSAWKSHVKLLFRLRRLTARAKTHSGTSSMQASMKSWREYCGKRKMTLGFFGKVYSLFLRRGWNSWKRSDKLAKRDAIVAELSASAVSTRRSAIVQRAFKRWRVVLSQSKAAAAKSLTMNSRRATKMSRRCMVQWKGHVRNRQLMRTTMSVLFATVKEGRRWKKKACAKLKHLGSNVRLDGAFDSWRTNTIRAKQRKRSVATIIVKRGSRERLTRAMLVMKSRVLVGRKLVALVAVRERWVSRERERLKHLSNSSQVGAYNTWKAKWTSWKDAEDLKLIKSERHVRLSSMAKAFFGLQMQAVLR